MRRGEQATTTYISVGGVDYDDVQVFYEVERPEPDVNFAGGVVINRVMAGAVDLMDTMTELEVDLLAERMLEGSMLDDEDYRYERSARMARAAEQGHSVARGEKWYHGSPSTGVPVELQDVKIGGVPVFKKGQPVDYSPYQFTQKPGATDFARANLQETFLIEQSRLEQAAMQGGEQGLLAEAAKIIDEQKAVYAND